MWKHCRPCLLLSLAKHWCAVCVLCCLISFSILWGPQVSAVYNALLDDMRQFCLPLYSLPIILLLPNTAAKTCSHDCWCNSIQNAQGWSVLTLCLVDIFLGVSEGSTHCPCYGSVLFFFQFLIWCLEMRYLFSLPQDNSLANVPESFSCYRSPPAHVANAAASITL